MSRWLLVITLLSGCADTLEDRLAELDAQAEVDCGYVSDCDSRADAEAVTGCLRDNRAAGVRAKALFELGLDPVAFVYTREGGYVSVEGYYDYEDGESDPGYFTEYRCRDIDITDGPSCVHAHTVDCEPVRDW